MGDMVDDWRRRLHFDERMASRANVIDDARHGGANVARRGRIAGLKPDDLLRKFVPRISKSARRVDDANRSQSEKGTWIDRNPDRSGLGVAIGLGGLCKGARICRAHLKA